MRPVEATNYHCFSVDVRTRGDECVITVTGEVDRGHAEHLQAVCLLALCSVQRIETVILELGEVTFVDSAGLSALVEIRDAAAASGYALRLREPSRQVARILEITGMDRVFAGRMDTRVPAKLLSVGSAPDSA